MSLVETQQPIRIAVWSGPRNISTALMRSWGNRSDTVVCDEPLYAYYLKTTRKQHPVAEDVIASQPNDWREVVAQMMGPVPEGKRIFYQKHMAHHLLPEIDRAWLDQLAHCFLIRHPQEVITSYLAKKFTPALDDLGFIQELEIFDYIRARTGLTPPVLDAKDVQNDPRRLLGLLCECLGIEFTEPMLCWPAGSRRTDGVWGKYWYAEVESSTSFHPHHTKAAPVPASLAEAYRQCLICYERLHEYRLR